MPFACSMPSPTFFTDVAILTSTFFPLNLTANFTRLLLGFMNPL